jgi:hypothetical protein
VPLKLFDYFSRGLPVVSTPIACLQEYKHLVYLGGTAKELADATLCALREPGDSPKKESRRAIARRHSITNISQVITALVDEVDLNKGT